jgi:hypothetical protein
MELPEFWTQSPLAAISLAAISLGRQSLADNQKTSY